jgi:hypothetical protein
MGTFFRATALRLSGLPQSQLQARLIALSKKWPSVTRLRFPSATAGRSRSSPVRDQMMLSFSLVLAARWRWSKHQSQSTAMVQRRRFV